MNTYEGGLHTQNIDIPWMLFNSRSENGLRPRLIHCGMQILSAPRKTSNRRNEDEKGTGKSQFHSRCFQRSVCHQRDHFAEGSEPLILSLAAMITDVDLGDDDGQAEKTESMIEMDIMNRAATFYCISFHQLAPRHEADAGGHHRHSLEVSWIGRLRPVTKQSSQIVEWIAQCAHIPIKDGDHLAWVR